MRATNFNVGEMANKFESSYNSQFRRRDGEVELRKIDKDMRNNLEASHWNHSQSYKKNFVSQNTDIFTKQPIDFETFGKNKKFGKENTLNQIATHYNLGDDINLGNYSTISQLHYRDVSKEKQPVYETVKMKNYQEKNHFQMGGVDGAKNTTSWLHFSKRHVLAA